ncbi:MAG: YihY/virulence factor BrkB family protein [Muribaculaceae bacterium]|nr:YihY/virulence factor BrkB family protein [Muribaculaceae bacterium]
MPKKKESKISKLVSHGQRIAKKSVAWYHYLTVGVWSDTRSTWRVDVVRTLSLSIKSFLDRDLQLRASALTYQTVLAIVPALAVLFAIGRGFGLQDMLMDELHKTFSGQQSAIDAVLVYVDNYLQQSSGGGIFVGIGVVFLLWTIISLLSNVENAFNSIWGLKQGRSFGRKITDYTAIMLILPVLLVCSNGLTIFMSTAMQKLLPFNFLTPAISWMLDGASIVLTWIFFAGTYLLIPNTKVKLTNALLAGCIAGTAFVILQWAFVSGQVYVAKYNAIYGSVAFLPLFLVWAQLAWVVTLSGAVVCYSSQNIFQFSFNEQIQRMSLNYRRQIAMAVMTVVVQRFLSGEKPLTEHGFAVKYRIPARLISEVTNSMISVGLLDRVLLDDKGAELGLQSAIPPEQVTMATVRERLNAGGNRNFVPNFSKSFANVINNMDKLNEASLHNASSIYLKDVEIIQP